MPPAGNSDAIETTTGSDWRNPVWDASGNMTDGPLPTAPTGTHVVKYDAWNRLVYADLVQPNYIRKYYYDGLNRMVHSAWYNPSVQNWDVEDHYYNHAWQRLQDYSSSAQDTPTTLAQTAGGAHVWSLRYIDALITNGSYYYTNDANFNVTSAVNTNGGDPAQRFGYDPYGQWHSYTVYNIGGQKAWYDNGQLTSYGRVLYAGYYADYIMKYYHVRNRAYNSAVGRWMQRDPIGYPNGMSLYGYVGGSPTRYVDPGGLRDIEVPGNSPGTKDAVLKALKDLCPLFEYVVAERKSEKENFTIGMKTWEGKGRDGKPRKFPYDPTDEGARRRFCAAYLRSEDANAQLQRLVEQMAAIAGMTNRIRESKDIAEKIAAITGARGQLASCFVIARLLADNADHLITETPGKTMLDWENPDNILWNPNDSEREKRPSAIGLGHEMIHIVRGHRRGGRDVEFEAVSFENMLRWEWGAGGWALRLDYSGSNITQSGDPLTRDFLPYDRCECEN